MEHFGLLALIPPILVVVLAIWTKDVIISLFLGILSGTLIVAGGNPYFALIKLTDILADMLADGWNIRIILFCGLLGALVGMWNKTGSARAFGAWAASKIKSRTGVLIFTWIFGILIFIDDYFNSLTIGACMKPVCDEKKISRAKLAYILDSTAAPVCIIAPISSWVITVMSYTKSSQGFDTLGVSEFTFFIRSIPYNLYAIFAILMVAFVAFKGRDFGPMARSEARAKEGIGLFDEKKYGLVAGKMEASCEDLKAKWFDFVVPLVLLIASAVFFFPMTTWMGAVDGEGVKTLSAAMQSMSLGEAFNNTDASKALFYSIIFTLVFSYVYFIARRLLDIGKSAEAIVDGLKSMVPAIVILTMAWSIGFIIKKAPADGGVGLANFLSQVVVNGGFPLWLLPLVVFLISCVISFATGTSWGTMAIMIPIALPIAVALGNKAGLAGDALINATLIPVASVMGGAVFGDHCSPISDTTILSSTGANCPHLEHVVTQMPYAIFVAVCCAVGVVFAGVFMSAVVGLAVTAALFVLGLIFLPKIWGEKKYDLQN
ncbi:MAG TPA: Na+/H+ antiporter NhaC family protein [Spirochaetales bacterium]|nr:Na+/H+ antiporter NhaC family protein [Spirochaetales bacterium]